jgi:hypothetical protein
VATVVVDGVPVETLSVTVEPLSTCLPAAGFCATTMPAGLAEPTLCNTDFRPTPVSAFTAEPCVWPTTCGTTTGFAPLEATSVTVVPVAAVTPAAGDCEITMSFGRDEATRVTVLLKPASVRVVCACCTGTEVTFGTAACPLEILIVTVWP